MRDFFINSFEKLITVLLVIMMIGVGLVALVMLFTPGVNGGFLPALVTLIVGSLYIIVVGGSLFLFLGIYQNTAEMTRHLRALAERP